MKRSMLGLMLLTMMATSAYAKDLSSINWRPWPPHAYRPSLAYQTIPAMVPPGHLKWVDRYSTGRVYGTNSRNEEAINDVVGETDTYWLLNPRRLAVCENPAGGICFKRYKPQIPVVVASTMSIYCGEEQQPAQQFQIVVNMPQQQSPFNDWTSADWPCDTSGAASEWTLGGARPY